MNMMRPFRLLPSRVRGFLPLLAVVAMAFSSTLRAVNATLYWDADAASAASGGTGAWLGTNVWSTDLAGTAHQNWNNASLDDAVFQGTPGVVTASGLVITRSLTFGVSGYTLSGAGPIQLQGGGGLVDTGANNATISAPITGAVGLVKQGTGLLTLSGANTYTGTTVIAAGNLRITGTHAPSAISIASGATLSGQATINAGVTAAVDSHIDRVDNFISTLNITNGFMWNGSSDGSPTIRMELDVGGVCDRIAVSGGSLRKGTGTTFMLDFGGTGSVATYTLFTVAGGTSEFTADDLSYTNLAPGLSGRFIVSDPNSIQFEVISDVAPTVAISSPSVAATGTGPVTYTITYTDSNFASSSLAVENVTLNATGTATGTVSVDSDTGSVRTVNISNISGAGTLGISIGAGTAVDTNGHLAPPAGPSATFVVDNVAPAITSGAAAAGNYQQAFKYTITANKNVTFGASPLPPGLAVDATTGDITGTAMAAGTFPVQLTATDVVGVQATKTLTITIAPKAVTVFGLTVVDKPYDGTVLATLDATNASLSGVFPIDNLNVSLKTSGAAATFADAVVGTNKPVSVTGLSLIGSAATNYVLTQPTLTGNIVGQPATVTISGLSRVYDGAPKPVTVVTNPAGLNVTVTYNGSTTAPTNAGSYSVVAIASGAGFGGSANGTLVIAQIPQTITFAALPDRLVSDGPVALSASASSGLPVTFTVSGPVTQVGNTLVNTGAEGTVTVTASQSGNVNYTAATNVVRTYSVSNRPSPGIYLGGFAGDRADAAFGFLLRPDFSGVFSGYLPTLGIGVTRTVQVDQSGAFSVSFQPIGSTVTVTLRGRITGGAISGNLDPFAITFSGTSAGPVSTVSSDTNHAIAAAARADGAADGLIEAAGAPVSGLYQVVAVGTSGTTTVTVFAGADGRAYVFSSDGTHASGAATTVSNTGALSVTLPDQSRVALTFAADGTVTGTLTPTSGVATTISGGAEAVAATQRMINMSARGRTSTGNAVLISGFVISGSSPKRVVVRVAGPILTNFDVPNVLPNPSLTIFNSSGTSIATNDDWGSQSPANPDIASQMLAAGAFPFGANSKDAAIVIRLAPGAYTVHALGGDGTVLTEVYELLDAGEAVAQKKIINFSARGQVGVAGEPLTAGFAIAGSVPKKVLIRGIGPSIASLLPGTIANPRVRVYNSAGVVLKENDDWFRDPDATQIAASAASVNAFALGAQSLDAALLIVLQPGSYTAIVDNVGGGTGLGLVEVYEVQ